MTARRLGGGTAEMIDDTDVAEALSDRSARRVAGAQRRRADKLEADLKAKDAAHAAEIEGLKAEASTERAVLQARLDAKDQRIGELEKENRLAIVMGRDSTAVQPNREPHWRRAVPASTGPKGAVLASPPKPAAQLSPAVPSVARRRRPSSSYDAIREIDRAARGFQEIDRASQAYHGIDRAVRAFPETQDRVAHARLSEPRGRQ